MRAGVAPAQGPHAVAVEVFTIEEMPADALD